MNLDLQLTEILAEVQNENLSFMEVMEVNENLASDITLDNLIGNAYPDNF